MSKDQKNLSGKKRSPVKAAFKIAIGVVFGLVAALALTPAFAAFHDAGSNGAVPFLGMSLVVLASAILAFFAKSIRKAFGRGCLVAGVALFALPISGLLLSGRAAHEVISSAGGEDQAAAAIGAGAAAAVVTGFATFVGLILGGIFCLIGVILILGGRREVIFVEAARD